MKEILLDYSEGELALHVFNDEGLYMLRGDLSRLMLAIRERFEFTDEQLLELIAVIDDDAKEEQ